MVIAKTENQGHKEDNRGRVWNAQG